MEKNKVTFDLILLLTTVFFCCGANAQKKEEVKIRVHYMTKFYKYEEQKTPREEETILDIGNKISHFYNLNSVRRDLIKDSILAKGGGVGDVINAFEKSGYPKAYSHDQVWKNYPSEKTLTHTDKSINHFCYSEPMIMPEWTLVAKDTIIANYKCQMAETLYFGRYWKVWFTLDIAISEGPFKLHGLPGLILQAEDSERMFSFSCIQIENIQDEYMLYPNKKSIQCTKEEYHNLIKLNWKSPYVFEERMTGFKGKGWDQNEKEIVYPERTAVFFEK